MSAGPIGEAHVLISPDFRGFGARLKTELSAAVRAVKTPAVKIQFDIHKGSLTKAIAEANKILKASGVKAKIEFDLNRGSLNRTLAQAKAAARSAGLKAKVDVDDGGSIRRTTRGFDLLGGRGRSALRSLNREVFNSNIRLREMANILGGATLPVLVSLASVGVAAFGSLTSAIVAASAAAAALPNFLAAAVQALGVGALAFGGLGDAVKAMGQAQDKAGASALSAARKDNTAAESIKAAQRGVRDALRGVRDAQRDLNDARAEARQRLVDLRFEEVRLSLDQRGAVLGIKEAEADLREVTSDPTSTRLQRERAALRVEEAKLARTEITRRIALNRQEIRSGVEGSDQVVAAKERQRDAALQVRDAQEALVKATRSAALSTAAAAAPVAKLATAMDKLGPAGQRFARFLFSLKPRFAELRALAQAGLFPGLEDAIRRLMGSLFPVFRVVVDQTARALGGLAREGAALLSSGPFRRDFAQLGRDNVQIIRDLGRGSFNLVDALRNVIAAARPLTLSISAMVLGWTENVRASAAAGRETGRLTRFFQAAGGALRSLARIAGNVGRTIAAVLEAAFPSGAGLLVTLEQATGRMRDLATSSEGMRNLREFFERARPAIETISGLVVTLARKLFEVVVHVKNATEAFSRFLDKHPEMKELLGTALALAFAFKALNVGALAGIIGSIGQLVRFNLPLALIAGAVLALGAAFVFAYTNSTPFREGVNSLARTIKDAVLPALKSFGGFITGQVIPALQRAIPFVRDQLVGGLDFLAQALKDNGPQLKLVGRLLLEIGKFIAVSVIPFLFKLWAVHLRGLFTALGLAAGAVGFLTRVFRVFVSGILAGFQAVLDGAATAFSWMPGLGGKLKTARDRFREFAKGVNASLDSTTKPRAIKVEANFGFQGLKTFNIKNSKVKAMARGGRILEGSGPTADDVLIRASRRETVVSAAHSEDPWFKAWAGYKRIPGFASGGRVGSGLNPEIGLPPLSVFQRALGHFEEGIGEAVRNAAQRVQVAPGGAVSGARFGGGAMGYIANFLRDAGVMFRIISGFRPGAVTRGTGRQSLHALGRALDLVGAGKSSMLDIWAAATRIPFRKEVIFSPAPFQVYGSGKHPGPPTNPRTRADHYKHVHVGLFDRGGWLMPGLTVAENRTGRPERVVPAGRDATGRLAFGGQGLHVENLVVQPLSGRFRLSDVMTELRLQGVH